MASRKATIYNDTTTYTGSVQIDGNLTVDGVSTTVNVQDLTVEDKTITVSSGNADADQAGLVVEVDGDSDKTFLFIQSKNQFASSIGLGVPDGSAAAPSITFESDNDTGMYREAEDAIGFAANGQKILSVQQGQVEYSNNTVDFTNRGTLPAKASVTYYVIGELVFSAGDAYRVTVWATAFNSGTGNILDGYFDMTLLTNGSGSLSTDPTLLISNVDAEFTALRHDDTAGASGKYTLALSMESSNTSALDWNLRVQVMPLSSSADLADVAINYYDDQLFVAP